MNPDPIATQKVAPRHLARDAYLYVRQSTARQVIENQESTARQYALRQRAIALGWPGESVVVIDCDLGQSGASSRDRAGFQRLVGDVGMGRAGIVLGLEVSRLARNSSDWHRLLEICAVTDTLILDEDGIYDPSLFNDRLLLGLKGTMSEAELHMLRARMRGGLVNKARRGELRLRLPVGFVYDALGRIVLDPDQQVQESVRLLFATYFRTGAAHATLKHFRQQGLQFPQRIHGGPRDGELVWGPLSLNRIASLLHNPAYAGTYAFGRSRCRTQPGGGVRRQFLPHEEWITRIPDAHSSYISWEQYLQIERQLAASAKVLHFHQAQGSPREGPALLQGRAVCGLCGQRMNVRYGSRRGQQVPNYVCVGRGQYFGDALCQSIVGTSIDAAISKLVVDSVTPKAIELAIAVQEELERRADEVARLRHREVERAEYEADQARLRYLHVDPTNRLVADSLEVEWNAKLSALNAARDDYDRRQAADHLVFSRAHRQQLQQLTAAFPELWNHPDTPMRERKRMLGLLIDDVTLTKQREVSIAVRFRGGATTTLSIPRPLLPSESRATRPEVRKLVEELADEHTDAQIAHVLNERGVTTGSGQQFDGTSVRWVRRVERCPSLKQRLLDAGWSTATQAGAALGIKRHALREMHVRGDIEARICDDSGQWLYWLPSAAPRKQTKSRQKPQATEVE
jgi:DNA invertase Pin-like site-specific DNA recombinase